MNYNELINKMAELSVDALEVKRFGKKRVAKEKTPLVAPKVKNRRDSRYIPRAVRYEVWRRDGGKCQNCSSQRNLQFDHIKPVAIGGESGAENLRLLCFHCNQRAAVKVFGVDKVSENWESV